MAGETDRHPAPLFCLFVLCPLHPSGIANQLPNYDMTSEPIPMLRVGNDGDVGLVEMQDLLFTTIGPTQGAILVEWNIRADSQGSAALWGKESNKTNNKLELPSTALTNGHQIDCHARIGGAIGTRLDATYCPAFTGGAAHTDCMAASLMMHLTVNSSGYFENMWLWTADHMVEYALSLSSPFFVPSLISLRQRAVGLAM